MKSRESARPGPLPGIALATATALAVVLQASTIGTARAQSAGPSMLVPNLAVRPVTADLVTPIGLAFVGDGDWLLIEKNTGQVKRIVEGAVAATALDLAVNNASERGLLGIALHPDFDTNRYVYLFWSCAVEAPVDPAIPSATECPATPTLGADSGDVLAAPLLGNRVDRFVWDGDSSTLTFDRNLITLRSFQNDGPTSPPDPFGNPQPARANHDGGIIRFGHDGKLYILFGDVGRRGQLQNLPSGPTPTGLGPTVADDQFGGPQADDAHYAGVIIRLNDDGTTPSDNPFFATGAAMGGEVGANVQKTFAYGIRNGFGMAVDPRSGNLWDQENGEDAFDEINLVRPGMNSGWIQLIGPSSRVAEFRQIETTSLHHEAFPNLQQFRWGPENIADTPAAALSRLFVIPGSHYSEPEFSWKHVLAPAAIGFLDSRALGAQYDGDLFVGFSVNDDALGGGLMRFNLTGNRQRIAVDDPRLDDRVADNLTFHETTESESLIVGRDFGIVTDIQTAPNGNLLVVSLDQGSIYEVFRSN